MSDTKAKPVKVGRSGALAAIAMLGALAAGSPAPTLNAPAPTQQPAPAPVREYVAPSKRRLAGKRRKAKRGLRDPLRSQPWKRFKNGDAIDGRGDFRSAKRELRRALCAKYGVTSGRQWVRLRRALRRSAV